MCVQPGSPRSPFCAPLRVYSAPRSAAPLCRYLCRNEISRSPLSCPWPRFGGGHATRNAVFLSTPHDTQNAQRTRSGQRPARPSDPETQKRRNAVAGRAGTDGVKAGRQLQHVRSKVLPSPSYYGTVLDGAAGSSTGSAGRAS